ncbi:MAG: 3-hydroxyacyl-CoA dehydrogenase family protein [Micromonosporaceae bacterium]|nr:3-hydroxyacyl-CoA dehydrogenase family protein [Micromonosporaceae bacterium]
MEQIVNVGVVGLGTMGAGIVEVFARNGLNVVAVEVDQPALERGQANLAGSTDRAVARGKLTEADRDALLGRVRFAVGLAALREVDLVVEAVPEHLDLKRRIFAELDHICKPTAILATNTSSLSVTEVAAATRRPGQVIGLHFFNPAPVMKLVEVIRTVVTADRVVADAQALCARLGKVAVTVADRAGFVANALLFGYLNQAVAMYEAKYATREDIDAAMRLGCGLPMGPLALMDLIGLDTGYQILDTMYRRGGRDRRHAPAPLLKQMVTAGLLGRKSGKGFYTYAKPGSSAVVSDDLTPTSSQVDSGRPVSKVGVAGEGAPAADMVEALTKAGYDVARGSPAELSDVDLVVAATVDTPVVECAMGTGRPADVVGLHLVNGVAEVVHTVRTAPEAVAAARSVAAQLGRTPVVCPDRAGFLVDALLFPYLNDAVKMVDAGYATVDDIDNAMKLGCGYPAGPFEVLDEVGLDTALARQRQLYRQLREPGLAPAPLLEQMVTAGYLGRKAGRGFRSYA